LVGSHTYAFSKSDKVVSTGLELGNGVGNDLVSSPLINFVVKGQDGGRMPADDLVVSSFTLGWGRTSGIARIKVPESKVLSTGVGNLANEVVVRAIGWPHERRRDAQNALERLFKKRHLTVNLVLGESGEVFVGPGVRRNLMTCVVSVLYALNVSFVIDTPVIVSVPEECSLGASSNQGIRNLLGVKPGSVIESQSDIVGVGAAGDDLGQWCGPLSEAGRGGVNRDQESGGD